MTRARWNFISRRDCDAWADEGTIVLDAFSYEMLMYIHSRTVANASVGLRRTTTSKIRESDCQINAYEEQNNIRLGPITRQHVSFYQARQFHRTEFTIPTNNTTRQAQFLDERRNDAIRRNTEADDDTGYLAGITIGKAKAVGSWQFDVNFRNVEADATIGAFSDSDAAGGGTDIETSRFQFKYQLAEKLQFAATWFDGEQSANGSGTDYQRGQFDVIAKF